MEPQVELQQGDGGGVQSASVLKWSIGNIGKTSDFLSLDPDWQLG